MTIGRPIGLGHYTHPWIGKPVYDAQSCQHGILRAVCHDPASKDMAKAEPLAWLSPPGGGREWTTTLACLQADQPT